MLFCGGSAKTDHKIDKRTAKFNTRLPQKKVSTYGSINKQEFWKLKRTLAPKSSIVPHAVLDKYGKEVTDICNIQIAYLDEFRYRLRQREISQNLKDYENIQNLLCHLRLKICQGNMNPDFIMQELSKAISELKNAKCTDSHGFTREIFKKVGTISHCLSLKWSTQSKIPKIAPQCGVIWSFKLL